MIIIIIMIIISIIIYYYNFVSYNLISNNRL